MGLLSDPEYGSAKWVRVLRRIHFPLGVLCYIGALVWFVMLGNRAFNNETYFSENALLPGLVTNGFNGELSAKTFFNEFLQELEDKYEDTDEMPVPWLVGKMSQLRLEVYTHNFTLNYPLGHGEVYKGTNVYGILRAPRTSSLEALVVTAPYRNTGTHLKGTAAGIALMLAFAEFARPQKYWAKDIIFLVTEHEQLGMQAWLEAYHGIQGDAGGFHASLGSFWKPTTPSLSLGRLGLGALWGDHEKCLDSGTLKGRSGSIQAAINLELDTPKIQYMEVKVEGLNGQLPNLDLVNLVHKLCVKSGIHHSYKNSYSWVRSRSKADEWLNGVTTMLDMLVTQMAGVPNGNHGLFHRFGIEAVTLEGRGARDPAGPAPRAAALTPANFHRLGSTLESILRSLNNLLERFHQSYFFYMLAATDRFISIGQYMPCLCLLCLAMLIRALALWVSIQKDEGDTPKSTKTTKSKESDDSSEEFGSGEQKGKELLGRIIPETCAAIYEACHDYCKLPSNESEWKAIGADFEKRWNFPNCLGAVDGKHIKIKPPPESGSYFFNYKHFHSQVLMAIANANYELIYFHFGTNGRVSDGGVIKNTDFHQKLINGTLGLPQPDSVNGITLPYVFVGDEAFALRNNFLKPFNKSQLNEKRRIFNYRLSRARRIIENVFGILVARFGILKNGINLDLDNITPVVMACCALHNFLRRENPDTYSPQDSFDRENYEVGEIEEGLHSNLIGLERRRGSGFHSATENRNLFVDYFNGIGAVPWQNNYV